MILLDIQNLQKRFSTSHPYGSGVEAPRMALSDVSFQIRRGEILAVVGESGSGKTTLGRCLLRLVPPDGGKIQFEGTDLLALPESVYRAYRSRFQMIFQDPSQALNPRQTVGECLAEVLCQKEKVPKQVLRLRVQEIMNLVRLPANLIHRLPRQLSGGEKQRLAFARVMALGPEFVVADEPTASLDSHLTWQMVKLLLSLKRELRLTVLLITHDIGLVASISDRIAVMLDGRLIELAPTQELLESPGHPYTEHLLRVAGFSRGFNAKQQSNSSVKIQPVLDGCDYLSRCLQARPFCSVLRPKLSETAPGHRVACHRMHLVSAKTVHGNRNFRLQTGRGKSV